MVAPHAADATGLRLAIFSDTCTPQINGLARTLERLVPAIEARGGAVRVETVDVPGAAEDPRLVRWGSIPFWAYPQLRLAAPRRAAVLRGLRAWRPTLVHATTPFGVGLAGRAAALAVGVPFVSSYHTSFAAYLRHYRLTALDAFAWPFQRWFHNGGRLTWAPSEATRRELIGHDIANVRVWGRGVDPLRFHPRFRSEEVRRVVGARPDDIVVAYVGRLAPEKGVHLAIDAMRAITARHGARVRFMLAGDGPGEARCRAAAPEGTWFAGMLRGEHLAAFYASADVFVMPSTTETFGNVVLEAMASGVPVVAPDAGATLELANPRTALTFRAGDASDLAAAIDRLVRDPSVREEKRAAGLAVAATRTWDAVWDALVRDYREAAPPVAPARAAA